MQLREDKQSSLTFQSAKGKFDNLLNTLENLRQVLGLVDDRSPLQRSSATPSTEADNRDNAAARLQQKYRRDRVVVQRCMPQIVRPKHMSLARLRLDVELDTAQAMLEDLPGDVLPEAAMYLMLALYWARASSCRDAVSAFGLTKPYWHWPTCDVSVALSPIEVDHRAPVELLNATYYVTGGPRRPPMAGDAW